MTAGHRGQHLHNHHLLIVSDVSTYGITAAPSLAQRIERESVVISKRTKYGRKGAGQGVPAAVLRQSHAAMQLSWADDLLDLVVRAAGGD